MNIKGENYRFTLGNYVLQSQRTSWDMEGKQVEYSVKDQYKDEYIRKLGNRYTNTYEIFDFTADEKTLLLSYNGTIQSFTQFLDTDKVKDVYCDIYYDPVRYAPSSCIVLVLTDVLVTYEKTNEYGDSGNTDIYNGYYLFDGTDDYVKIKDTFKTLPTNFTIAFWYNYGGRAAATEAFLESYYTLNKTFEMRVLPNGLFSMRWKTSTSGTGAEGSVNSNSLIPLTDSWNYIILKVDTTQANDYDRVRLYVNGVDDTDFNSAVAQNTVWTGISPFTIGARAFLSTNDYNYGGKLKHFLITTHSFSAADITNFGLQNLTAIPNRLIWYPMNEADPGAPYDDTTIDAEGNYNGTPTNITGATFFNQLAYDWYIHDPIVPDSLYPKIALIASPYTEYTFSDEDDMPTCDLEFDVENNIDWEAVSITGKLHRNYTSNSAGNVKQNITLRIKRYKLDRDEYDSLKIYDGQDVKIYPDSTNSEYYEAHCDILFLNYSNKYICDYAELVFTVRGEVQS